MLVINIHIHTPFLNPGFCKFVRHAELKQSHLLDFPTLIFLPTFVEKKSLPNTITWNPFAYEMAPRVLMVTNIEKGVQYLSFHLYFFSNTTYSITLYTASSFGTQMNSGSREAEHCTLNCFYSFWWSGKPPFYHIFLYFFVNYSQRLVVLWHFSIGKGVGAPIGKG